MSAFFNTAENELITNVATVQNDWSTKIGPQIFTTNTLNQIGCTGCSFKILQPKISISNPNQSKIKILKILII